MPAKICIGSLLKGLPDVGWCWVKSFLSLSNGNCVEVTNLPGGGIGVRDSKNPDGGPVLRFTQGEWQAFVERARNGEFDSFAAMSSPASSARDNLYSFLKWVLENLSRTLRLALLLAVIVAVVVLAPHLLNLFP